MRLAADGSSGGSGLFVFLMRFLLILDGLGAPEVNIGGCDVAEAFVIPLLIVILDDGVNLVFQISRQVIVFRQDPVFERLMPAFDLALGLQMMRCLWRV